MTNTTSADRAAEPEIWKPMARFEAFALISNRGRVKSLKRFSVSGNRYYGGKLLKPVKNAAGYPMVNLGAPTNGMQLFIHRMVLETFVGPCPEGMEACHEDGNRTNGWLSNLRWDTRKNNALDRVRHGTGRGERNPGAILTDYKVGLIRSLNYTDEEWAEEFGVRPSIIAQARCGRTWKHVPEVPIHRGPRGEFLCSCQQKPK